MASPLEGSLAKTIGKAFNNIFLNATLAREVAVDSPAPEPGEPANTVTQEFNCKALTEEYSDYYKLQNMVQANERKILVLANSLNTTPQQNDKITIRSNTYTVVSVGTDPALATWELRATG